MVHIIWREYSVCIYYSEILIKKKLQWFQVLEMNEKFYLSVLKYSHILPIVTLCTIDIEIIL